MTTKSKTATHTATAPASSEPVTTSNAIALRPVTTEAIARPSTLGENPNKLAAMALTPDPDMPADTQMLGKDPWTDYLQTQEGRLFRGEIVAVLKRFEEEEQKDGSKILKPRALLILRTTVDGQVCQKKWEQGDPVRGEIVEEKERGATKRYDVYKVPAGTLVATNFRTIMKPFVPFAHGVEAIEALVKIGPQVESKRNAKEHYWDMRIGVRKLGYLRDDSIDYLSQQGDQDGGDLDAPFLSGIRSQPPWQDHTRNLGIFQKRRLTSFARVR